MKNLFYLFSALLCMGCIKRQQNNEIFYTSTNGEIIQPNEEVNFGANIVSNTYEDGKGIILFDADVTTIGKNAFEDNDCLSTISLPNSITTIGHSAFDDCDNLSEVVLSTKLDSIGDYAFYDCNLKEIRIPDSVKSVSRYAFECSSLSAFYGKLASDDNRCLIINGELVAFAPHGISDYTIPQSVNAIPRNFFRNLESIKIPDGVTTIETFYDCRKLHSIILPSTLTTIKDCAFCNCVNLTSIDLPNGVTEIGYGAFDNCENLTSIDLPNGITEIKSHTFVGCINLSNVKFPNSVKIIGSASFANTAIKELILPSNVERIEGQAFRDCYNLTNIKLPNSLSYIGDGAFMDCCSLEYIDIPNHVSQIGESAFIDCTNLKEVKIGSGCKRIGSYAFKGCSSIECIYCYSKEAPADGILWPFPRTCIIYIPKGSYLSYLKEWIDHYEYVKSQVREL